MTNKKIPPIINISDIRFHISNLSQLVFEVTDSCNLKCTYCGYGEMYNNYDERKEQYLTFKKAKVLLDYLQKYWASSTSSYSKQIFISFYGGEPLLNMHLIQKIVEYIEQLSIPKRSFVFSMTTNATLLSKYIDYLVEKDFDILISLDGNENCNIYRVDHSGKSSFNLVCRNIKLVQEKYPSFLKKKIRFNAVLNNKSNIDAIIDFFDQEFNKMPRISELNTLGIRNDKKELFTRIYRNKYLSLRTAKNYEELQENMFHEFPETRTLFTYLYKNSGNVFRTYNDLLFEPSPTKVYPNGTCFPFSRKLFVTVNGKILPCERIGYQYALGEVTYRNVILNFEEIANKYNTWFNKLSSQCANCLKKNVCTQCIFMLYNLEKDPVCNEFMNEERFKNYVNEQMSYLNKHPRLYSKIMKELIVR